MIQSQNLAEPKSASKSKASSSKTCTTNPENLQNITEKLGGRGLALQGADYGSRTTINRIPYAVSP
jgi:hypothetical protein